MRFFFDRNMSPRLARMMASYAQGEHEVRAHDDDERFTATTPDVEWLGALAADHPPWVILSADGRILRNRVERQALREANITFVSFGRWAHMRFPEYAWKLVRVWPELVRVTAACAETPTIFEVAGGHGTKVNVIQRTSDPS
jgi:hypothetical protein